MDYEELAPIGSVQKTVESLKANRFLPIVVDTKEQALEKIKELIPANVSVMNGSSKTLEQIGFVEYLKAGQHGWNNLHEKILAETDPEKQGLLRKQSVNSDFYLGSVHAISETGEMLIASATGSQLPHLAFTSHNVILVISTKKIVSSIDSAFKRIQEHILPLEDLNMKSKYGPEAGTLWAKTLILHKEHPMMDRKVTILLVNEVLGF